jgi:HlyD family secretion protein
MSSSPIFRKVAMDRLSSPEQLDQLTQVTNPRGWLALAGFGAIILVAIGWGVLGRIPERVSGTGMLLKSGGVLEVGAPSGGQVSDVSVQVGELVREGQVIARIDQPELADQLQQARVAVANARAEDSQVRAFQGRDQQLRATMRAQERGSKLAAIAADERSLRWLEEKIAAQEQLVRQGLLTRGALVATREQYDASKQKVAQARNGLTQLDAQSLSAQNTSRDQLQSRAQALEAALRKADELEREIRTKSQVVSSYTGRILEVMTEQGAVVQRGAPIISLDMTGRTVKGLEAVLYVPAAHGKQIQPGMPIQIAPSTVKQEEYGLMLGRVTYVSNFPATSRGVQRVMKNDQLVQALTGGTAPYEVHADLAIDPTTRSRYRWSSSGGPPVEIQSGTLAVGNIEIASRRPIALVIPLFREYTGL